MSNLKKYSKCGGKRGCELSIILPFGCINSRIHSRDVQRRNDIKKVLRFTNINLYQKLEKKRQMEASNIKTFRPLHLLSNSLDKHIFLDMAV